MSSKRFYKWAAWADIRETVLTHEPLCRRCDAVGKVTIATVVHHVEQHNGDIDKFFNGPFEPLCKRCHDSGAQQEEKTGYRSDLGEDGWPVDPKHPANA